MDKENIELLIILSSSILLVGAILVTITLWYFNSKKRELYKQF